jgi:predicted permease
VRWENTITVEGSPAREGEDMQAGWNQLLPGFFSTLGIPLLSGREFTDRDVAGAPKVVVVNESFVRRFFPRENPIGRRIGFGSPPEMEIVGVVKDFKGGSLKDGSKPAAYTPALQNPAPSAVTFYAAGHGDPMSIAGAARQVVAQLDSSLPLYDVKSVEAQIGETHFAERMFAILSVAFGAIATLLAAVGIFGVTSYAVTRRTREIGIRVALGARRNDVLRMVIREMVVIVAAGALAGILLALASGRLVESQLFGLRSSDPAVIAAAVLVVAVAALAAAYIPCRRAARVDVVSALRYE